MVDLTRFTPTQRRILTHVVSHPTATKTAIAEALRLTRSHVSKLMNTPPLSTALADLQLAQFDEATRIAVAASTDAIVTLASIVNDSTAARSDRIKAARVLLEFRIRDVPEKPKAPEKYVCWITRDGVTRQKQVPWDGSPETANDRPTDEELEAL